ncbi:MAG TPA: hypothetical protein VGM92_01070 [Candidatus Kapabacteria bacterium]
MMQELDSLSKLTDDVALVVVGHLFIEQKCVDILNAFFNYDDARTRLERAEYSQLINLLRLSNLCNDKILNALGFLGNLRNKFAHSIVSLSLLDRRAPEKDNALLDTFHGLCKGFGVKENTAREMLIDFLRRIRVDLRRTELIAMEINKFINKDEFIDSLEPIKI